MIVINPDFIGDGASLWWPVVTRLTAFARAELRESDPEHMIRQLMARVLVRDPNIQLQVLIREQRVVGATLAMLETDGAAKWVYLLFATMQAGVDVRPDSEHAQQNIERWAQSLGIGKILMASTRSAAALGRRYGYRESRVIYVKDLAEVPVEVNGGPG